MAEYKIITIKFKNYANVIIYSFKMVDILFDQLVLIKSNLSLKNLLLLY